MVCVLITKGKGKHVFVQRLVVNTPLRRSGMACILTGFHSFTCRPRVYPLTEWTIPAFAFPAEAGTHLPIPEGWKAELALGGWLVTYQISVWHRELNPDTAAHLSTRWLWNYPAKASNRQFAVEGHLLDCSLSLCLVLVLVSYCVCDVYFLMSLMVSWLQSVARKVERLVSVMMPCYVLSLISVDEAL